MVGDTLSGDIQRLLMAEEIEGERRANYVRLFVVVTFFLIFSALYLKSEDSRAVVLSVFGSLAFLLVYVVVVHQILARERYKGYVKYLDCAVDISWITSVALVKVFWSGSLEPGGWVAYITVLFLFISLSGLRFSASLCFYSGVLSSAEFLVVNLAVFFLGGEPLLPGHSVSIIVMLQSAGIVVALTSRTARELATRASMAERQRAHLAIEADHAKWLADTDELTDLYNRRYLMVELNRERARSSRLRKPFALLIIDLDNFKQVNDSLGHMAGDLVLRRVASILRRRSREADVVARFGGDEFGLILCETNPEEADVAAQRLCQAVRENLFEVEGEVLEARITLSVGVACFPADGTSVEDLLRIADRALYAAKSLGRDRVVFARDLSGTERLPSRARLQSGSQF